MKREQEGGSDTGGGAGKPRRSQRAPRLTGALAASAVGAERQTHGKEDTGKGRRRERQTQGKADAGKGRRRERQTQGKADAGKGRRRERQTQGKADIGKGIIGKGRNRERPK